MASLINSTLTFLQNFNFSFSGFLSEEIYEHDKWTIKPRKMSTTILVKPEHFDAILCELTTLYDTPDNRGLKHGLIYKCPKLKVTLTCYPTTKTISVQGSLHSHWIDTVLQDISQALHQDAISPTPSPAQTDDEDLSEDEMDICPAPMTSTPFKPSSHVSTATTEVQTQQSGDNLHSLQCELQQLRNANKDLSLQLKEYRELRSNYIQLSHSYKEQCERNDVLQVRIASLLTDEPFTTCKNSKLATASLQENIQSTPPAATVSTSNSFAALPDELPAETVPSAPNISLMTPEKSSYSRNSQMPRSTPRATTGQSQPQTQSPTQKPSSPQIVIFSNSICKRINPRRFYRGKVTEVFAKGGATIGDVQKMVTDYQKGEPDIVILQAWTNSTARNTSEECFKYADTLVNVTMDKFPNAKIIISGNLPRCIPISRNNYPNRVSADLNRKLRDKCHGNDKLIFVDQAISFIDAHTGHINTDLFWDYVHLNNRGLGIYVRNLRQVITSLCHPHRFAHQPIENINCEIKAYEFI